MIAKRDFPVIWMLHEALFICPRLTLLRSPTSEPCTGPGPIKCLECMYSHYDGSIAAAAPKLTWRIPRLGAYPAYRILRRRSARQLAGAFACSEFIARVYRPHLDGRVEHIPFGINVDRLPEARPVRPHNPMRFGFFGGFQPVKGVEDVLDAAVGLKRDGLQFELYILGQPKIWGLWAATYTGYGAFVRAHSGKEWLERKLRRTASVSP